VEYYKLHQELDYNSFTGFFTRRSTGERACRTDHTKGYFRVFVLGKYYKAHRLAWYYYYGKWPVKQLDHIDGNKSNNAILNLREVTQTQNMYNQTKAHKQNKSGVIGVGVSGKNFVSKIKVGDKLEHLGTYKTKEEAYTKYIMRKAEIVNGMDTRP
jgi:hypothetical protein